MKTPFSYSSYNLKKLRIALLFFLLNTLFSYPALLAQGNFSGDSLAVLISRKKYPEAIAFLDKRIILNSCRNQADSIRMADDLFQKGQILRRTISTRKLAGQAFEKALVIQRELAEKYPLSLANTMSRLAYHYWDESRFGEAKLLYEKAIDIRTRIGGEEDTNRLRDMFNLGLIHWDLYDYGQSERIQLQVLEKRRKLLGELNPFTGYSYNALGLIYLEIGQYNQAEKFLQEAMEIRRKTDGENSVSYSASLYNLALLSKSVGDYEQEKYYLKKALNIRTQLFGGQDISLANIYNALANCLIESSGSQTTQIKSYFRKARDLRIREYGEIHPLVSESFYNEALFERKHNNFGKAEMLLNDALKISNNVFNNLENPAIADILYSLAEVQLARRNYSKADSFNEKAISIYSRYYNKIHPKINLAIRHAGIINAESGNRDKALLNFLTFIKNGQKYTTSIIPFLGEEQKSSFLRDYRKLEQSVLGYLLKESLRKPELRDSLYNNRLIFKGIQMNTSARWKQRIKSSGDMKLIRKFEEWEKLKNQFSQTITRTDSISRFEADSIKEKIIQAESELNRRAVKFGKIEKNEKYSWKEVQKKLLFDEAAVEIFCLPFENQKIGVIDTSNQQNSICYIREENNTLQYAALIVTPNCKNPELIFIGLSDELDKWLKYYQNSVRILEKDLQSYSRFWQPLAPKLKGKKKVWLSVDGVYHKINLNTLINPVTGRYLFDEIQTNLVGSTRELLQNSVSEENNNFALLVGNPEFYKEEGKSVEKSRSAPDLSYFIRPDSSITISELPGTKAEIDSVSDLLQKKDWEVEQITGTNATEEKVKDSFKPRVLLFSTHGFFNKSINVTNAALLQSGLLLTGSEKTLRTGRNIDGEDGILTAYEAMNLNLDNTELVVLSACETGLGLIENGEGVFGLQHSFRVAGAKNLIMSLWKVNDEVTRGLMVRFFRNWLNGIPKREAFLKAQKEIRLFHPEPFYWGGFIYLGK